MGLERNHIPSTLHPFLRDYRALLGEVDAWFARSLDGAGDAMRCAQGCSACCRGLFDITLLDACLLRDGFERLAAPVRGQVRLRALRRLAPLRAKWPGFAPPYLLNDRPEDEWRELSEGDETPCPLLSPDGCCLVYDFRPMTCRLHGLPHVDLSGEVFEDEWCTLNFPGENPLLRKELRWEFRRLFTRELALFRGFTRALTGSPRSELDLFLPTAVLVDFGAVDWRSLPASSHTAASE